MSAEKGPSVACAVLHTDAEGNPVACPGYPHLVPRKADENNNLTLCAACGRKVREGCHAGCTSAKGSGDE